MNTSPKNHRIEDNEDAKAAKIKNILEMALDFTAMIRLFETGSKEKILFYLESFIPSILNSETELEYKDKHGEFCEWFVSNIKTAERYKNGLLIKKSGYASWGQAAKVLDITLKVCVYYCHLPSCERADKMSVWLNGAIDTPILENLKKCYNCQLISKTSTIEGIDKEKYEEIQKMIRSEIKDKYTDKIVPVQFDDIIWRALNRGK